MLLRADRLLLATVELRPNLYRMEPVRATEPESSSPLLGKSFLRAATTIPQIGDAARSKAVICRQFSYRDEGSVTDDFTCPNPQSSFSFPSTQLLFTCNSEHNR